MASNKLPELLWHSQDAIVRFALTAVILQVQHSIANAVYYLWSTNRGPLDIARCDFGNPTSHPQSACDFGSSKSHTSPTNTNDVHSAPKFNQWNPKPAQTSQRPLPTQSPDNDLISGCAPPEGMCINIFQAPELQYGEGWVP
jgi:hypothetical protein